MTSKLWFLLVLSFANIVNSQTLPCSPLDYDSEHQIPHCTFGCFCVGTYDYYVGRYGPRVIESSATICVDPKCSGVIRCANPTISCGCPECGKRLDCVAKDENGNEIIIDDGPPQQVGCAVCKCLEPEPAEPCPGCSSDDYPDKFRRQAICDYSNCACKDYEDDQIFETSQDIPECTFGCFCIRSKNAVLCKDPGACEVSNRCQNPEYMCGCPYCEDGDCLAKDFEGGKVVISDNGPQQVGCAVCTCEPPIPPVVLPFFTPETPIPLVPIRKGTCDYSQCACYGHDESEVFDTAADIPECTFGCFCIRSENVVLCKDPGPCAVSNKCQNPEFVCGCPVCEDGDCLADKFKRGKVVISDDGPQKVGCAVCTCEPPVPPIVLPFFTPGTPIPPVPPRAATCDYSQCACYGHDEAGVFDTVADIPECTFGCFCIRSQDAVLCIDPAPCEVSNKCIEPDFHECGCPGCEEGNCLAKKFKGGEVVISDDGPQKVGCAVCTCDPPDPPIIVPFFTPGITPPLPPRTATCDYTNCPCYGHEESEIFETDADIPPCTFGCFCIREHNALLCIDPPVCEFSNLCHEPETQCGCPACQTKYGDCYAERFKGGEVVISGDGPQKVGCAVCTCNPPFTNSEHELIPKRTATCDYSNCPCYGYDESQILETESDFPECVFGCFCIREHNAELCADPPLCEVSNLCHEPDIECGCPACQNEYGDCYAERFKGGEVVISGDGPQKVGCAVCTCEPPFSLYPFGPLPEIPKRKAICYYSQCACMDYDDEQVFDTIGDIPECTFGCFCIRSEGNTLCIDPAPCKLSNKCQHPEKEICGCPICEDGDCYAESFKGEEILISDDGPQKVGCAVCTCDPPSPPTYEYYFAGQPLPHIPPRMATCDYSNCGCRGYDESDVYDSLNDVPECHFGCFCIRETNNKVCIDPPVCLISNICVDPVDVCGCPTCEAGNCYAKTFRGEDVLISDDGPQNVGCAECTCYPPSPPFDFPYYQPGMQKPVFNKRGHSCDYSRCHGYVE